MDSIDVKRVQRPAAQQQQQQQQVATQPPRPNRPEARRDLVERPPPPPIVPPALTKGLDHVRKQLYNALPIPPQVVPLVASVDEVLRYEGMFRKGWKTLTIGEVLHPFNGVVNGRAAKGNIGKVFFLTRFIKKVAKNDLNRDIAIVCRNLETEEILDQHMKPAQFNTKLLSQHFRDAGLYGMMIKIRKNDTPQTWRPIERDEVDTIFVFDAACEFEKYNQQTLLKGTYTERPHIVYLCPMDSAEIRIHTYNRFINDTAREIRWDTKIANISSTIRDIVLLQPNRKVDHTFLIAWNDYLSQGLLNWACYGDRNEPYEHRFQKKGGLIQQILDFPTHHPTTYPRPARPQFKPSVKAKVAANQAVNALQSTTQANAKIYTDTSTPSPRDTPPVLEAANGLSYAVNGNSNSVAGPSQLPLANTAASTTATTAAVSGIHPGCSAILTNSHNNPENDTASNNTNLEANDYSRKDWQVAAGSNASAMAESLKRSPVHNEEESAQNKRIKESNTTFPNPFQVNLSQIYSTSTPPVAPDPLASSNVFSASNIPLPAAASANTSNFNDIPMLQQPSSFAPAIQNSNITLGYAQQAPVLAQQASVAAQQGLNNNEVPLNNAMFSTTSTLPAAIMTPTDSLVQEYEDFMQKALKKFETDIFSLL